MPNINACNQDPNGHWNEIFELYFFFLTYFQLIWFFFKSEFHIWCPLLVSLKYASFSCERRLCLRQQSLELIVIQGIFLKLYFYFIMGSSDRVPVNFFQKKSTVYITYSLFNIIYQQQSLTAIFGYAGNDANNVTIVRSYIFPTILFAKEVHPKFLIQKRQGNKVLPLCAFRLFLFLSIALFW